MAFCKDDAAPEVAVASGAAVADGAAAALLGAGAADADVAVAIGRLVGDGSTVDDVGAVHPAVDTKSIIPIIRIFIFPIHLSIFYRRNPWVTWAALLLDVAASQAVPTRKEETKAQFSTPFLLTVYGICSNGVPRT